MPSRHALQRNDAASMARPDEEQSESSQAEIDRGVDEEAGKRWRNRGCMPKGQDQDEVVGAVNCDQRPDGVHSQAGCREQDANQRSLEHLIHDTSSSAPGRKRLSRWLSPKRSEQIRTRETAG